MKSLVLIAVIILTVTATMPLTAQDKPSSEQDKKVIKLIASLPEVISLKHSMLKANIRPLIFAVEVEPTMSDPYFRVAISEDMLSHSFMYYRFCVNAKTYAISYYDTIKGKKIPLKVWRQHGRKI